MLGALASQNPVVYYLRLSSVPSPSGYRTRQYGAWKSYTRPAAIRLTPSAPSKGGRVTELRARALRDFPAGTQVGRPFEGAVLKIGSSNLPGFAMLQQRELSTTSKRGLTWACCLAVLRDAYPESCVTTQWARWPRFTMFPQPEWAASQQVTKL